MRGKRWMFAAALLAALGMASGAARADRDAGWQALQARLHLTTIQMSKVKPIFADFCNQRIQIREAFQDRVNRVLRPDQQARLLQLTAPPTPRALHSRAIRGRLLDELNLTPDQRSQIEQIGRQKAAQLRACEARLAQQLRGFLSSDQVDRFSRLIREHESHFGR